MLRIIFAGGRDFTNVSVVHKILEDLIDINLISHVDSFIGVNGTAKGADSTFADELRSYGVAVEDYPADWKDITTQPVLIGHNAYGEYNKLAGHNRNELMASIADVLVAVHNGSKGTLHMINTMEKLGKPVYVYNYGGSLIQKINL